MFKKVIFITSLLVLPFISQAGPNQNVSILRGGNRGIDQKLIRRAESLQIAIERNIDFLSQSEKEDALKLIGDALRLVRGNSVGGDVIVKFDIESTGFVVESPGSIEGLISACKVAVEKSRIGNVDDISVEVNGARSALKTSGWWTSTSEICQVVTALAIEAGNKTGTAISGKRYVISGNADGLAILADGNSLNEVKSSCVKLTTITQNVDDVTVSLNGGPKKSRHTSGWWTTSSEVCQTAISLVF